MRENENKLEIDKDILAQTTKCLKDFICLKCENGDICAVGDICEVEKFIFDGYLFVKPKDGGNCDYHIDWGGEHICRCPTRKEIYKKYEK